jgi:hypothetical protein
VMTAEQYEQAVNALATLITNWIKAEHQPGKALQPGQLGAVDDSDGTF